MLSWFKKSQSLIFQERIVDSHRTDIFVQPPKAKKIADINYFDVTEQTLTPEFAEYCKKYYSQYIRPNHYYIHFSFMSPPAGKIYESDTKIEITEYNVCWGNCDYGYIQNPKNNREYIPLKPVFRILCELMDETNKPYTVNVNLVKYNTTEWEQDNMLLTFSFVQQPKLYNL
jgi:hypothetical protein